MIPRLLPIIATALLLVACPLSRHPQVTPPSPEAVAYEPGHVEGGLFLQGFDVRWNQRPHRLSRLAVAAQGTVQNNDAQLNGSLRAEVRGGTWASGAVASDTPLVSVRYGGLLSEDVTFLTGTAELVLHGRLSQRRNPADAAASAIDILIDLPPGAPRAASAAWLTGFDLRTGPSHPDGYTPHGIEVWLGPPEIRGDSVKVRVSARFEAAPVLDRRQQLATYGAEVRVDYAIVLSDRGVTRRFGIDTAIDHGIEPLKVTSRAGPARFPISVELPRGPATVISGLSGFSFLLQEPGPVAGRYMRALTATLEDERYDRARGSYDAVVALRFANSGQLARGVKVDAAADFTVLQLERGADVRSGRWLPPADGQRHVTSYPGMTWVE